MTHPPFTPSQRALIYSCRHPDETEQGRLRALLKKVAWPEIFPLAVKQGVAPLVYKTLKSVPESVPENVLGEFQTFYLGNRLRNRHLGQQLLELLEAFRDAAVPALSFKGPLLSEWAYGDVGLRQFGDLDLLVEARDAYRAQDLMLSLNFRQDNAASPETDGYHFAFEHRETGLIVEVHWSLTAERFALSPDLSAWWQRRVTVTLLDTPIQTFCPEDTLLYASLHGLKHAWQSLNYGCDVAAVLRTLKPDLALVRKRARNLHCERALDLALSLASDFTLSHEKTPPILKSLRGRVHRSLFGPRHSAFSLYRFWWAARERPGDKLRLPYQFVRTLSHDLKVNRAARSPSPND